MRFAFSWDHCHINNWSWLPVVEYRPIPFAKFVRGSGGEVWFYDEFVEKHLYLYWGYGQWHWVWGDRINARA